MTRVAAIAFVCAALGALLLAGDRGRAASEVLARETAGLLPSGTRILTSEYRKECLGFLMPSLPAWPCISSCAAAWTIA